MDTEPDSDQLVISTSPHHSPRSPKLKRLKKMNAFLEPDGLYPLFSESIKIAVEPEELNQKSVVEPNVELGCLHPLFSESDKAAIEPDALNKKSAVEPNEEMDCLDPSLSESVGLDPLFSESDKIAIEPKELNTKNVVEANEESELDGLDPLFSEGVKRVLEFTGPEFHDSESDKDVAVNVAWKNKRKRNNVAVKRASKEFLAHEFADDSWDKDMESLGLAKPKKTNKRKNADVQKARVSKKKENEERKAYLAQQADFQRVMRERKSVGFKPVPVVEKPISSVLEKIRQRKMEVSKKMVSRSVNTTTKEIMLDNHVEDEEFVIKDVLDASEFDAPVNEASEDKSCSSDGKTRSNDIPVEETVKSFRPPLDDTQDLFTDSQASDSQETPLTASTRPVEDVSLSLNLRLDYVLSDDMSSGEEESDKENTEPLPKPSRKDNLLDSDDPLRKFLDEEALEDDSDDELLNPEDKDEEDDDETEDLGDFIDTDYKEKLIDRERRNQLHQTLVQQDELKLKKPKYDTSHSDDEDDDYDDEDVGFEVKNDKPDSEDTEDHPKKSSTKEITTMLIKMIPQMFTDEDDGYVSSEDETDKSLSKENLSRKKELERKKRIMSAAKDVSSKEVLGHIRKLNSVPATKKKANTPSVFDALLSKGSSSNSNKSFFLRRASNNPVPSSHRQGPSTGRSFIFGRDDSRSSAPVIEDSRALNQSESQVKKVVSSAKFSGSQVKWCNQETQQVAGTSLFDILKPSSVQNGQDSGGDNMIDHEAVFASFKPVKRQIRVDGRL